MKTHAANAAYGVLDYAAYPVGMLVAAPFLLHRLGAAEYGVWIVCTAAVSTGGIIASGFGDANIQLIATQRSRRDVAAMAKVVRNMMGINLLLGVAVMLLALVFVPILSRRLATNGTNLYHACAVSLCLACVLMLVRALESVCISTQRAFERYGKAIGVSVAGRLATIACAVVLAAQGFGVVGIMAITFLLVGAGTVLQLVQLKRLVAVSSLWPQFDRASFDALFGFGFFSWLQTISTVLFSQADRLLLGASLGAAAVTSYVLCVQIAQPIYGLAAAGCHFLFPYLAGRYEEGRPETLRRAVITALLLNTTFVVGMALTLQLGGRFLLHVWLGKEIATSAATVLSPIVWGFAFLGLSVPAYYALLAFGRVRTVTWTNLYGGLAMLCLFLVLSRNGIQGIAFARLAYGGIALTMYYPLFRLIARKPARTLLRPGFHPVGEEL